MIDDKIPAGSARLLRSACMAPVFVSAPIDFIPLTRDEAATWASQRYRIYGKWTGAESGSGALYLDVLRGRLEFDYTHGNLIDAYAQLFAPAFLSLPITPNGEAYM